MDNPNLKWIKMDHLGLPPIFGHLHVTRVVLAFSSVVSLGTANPPTASDAGGGATEWLAEAVRAFTFYHL